MMRFSRQSAAGGRAAAARGVVRRRRRRPRAPWAAAAFLTAAALVLLVLPLFGFRAYVVTGDSMRGTFNRGALLLTRTVPVASLKVGDVITFRPPQQQAAITHRIVEVLPQSDGRVVFRTKGDANEAPDPWQFTLDHPQQAKYLAHVPYLGYAFGALGLRPVRAALIAVFGLLVVGTAFSALWERLGERLPPVRPPAPRETDRWRHPSERLVDAPRVFGRLDDSKS